MNGHISKAILAVYFLLTLCGGLSVQAAEPDAFLPTGGFARAPAGHVDFCRRFPAECRTGDRISAVRLSADAWQELIEVNQSVNARIRPETDADLYGVQEYWDLGRNAGDCEEYVLAKRHELIARGWPVSVLLITVVRDETGEGHAVLTLRTDRGDLVLDNKRATIMPWKLTGYRFVKMQSQVDARAWTRIDTRASDAAVASIRR